MKINEHVGKGAFMISRKLEKTSRVKPTISFFSRKNSSMMFCESYLEVNALLKFEFDETVESYLTQPGSTQYLLDGVLRRYTPDVLVKYIFGDFVFWEIKPYKKTLSEKFLNKFEQLTSHFKDELNQPLRLMTSNEIKKGKSAANLSQLYPFLDWYQDELINQRVTSEVAVKLKITVQDLEMLVADYGQSPEYAWSMLAHKHFKFDETRLLIRTSTLEIAA